MNPFEGLTQKNQEKKRILKSQTRLKENDDNLDDSVESTTFSLIFPQIFQSLPPSDPTETIKIDKEYFKFCVYCCDLARNAYLLNDKRELPKEVGPIIYDQVSLAPGQVPFYVTNSDELDTIFIAIRGTYCYADFITDLTALPVNTNDGEMHVGVYIAAQICFYQVESLVLNLSASYANRPIVVVGHSLGGAVADAVCRLFCKKAPHIKCRSIVFAPAASCSRTLYNNSLATTTTFIRLGDPIPFLSLENITKVLRSSISQTTAIALKNLCSKIVRNQRDRMKEIRRMPPDFNPFKNKAPPILPNEEETADGMCLIPMYPPGKYYLFRTNDEGIVSLHNIPGPDYFGHFCNDLCEFNHTIAGYQNTVHKFYEQLLSETNS